MTHVLAPIGFFFPSFVPLYYQQHICLQAMRHVSHVSVTSNSHLGLGRNKRSHDLRCGHYHKTEQHAKSFKRGTCQDCNCSLQRESGVEVSKNASSQSTASSHAGTALVLL